MHDGTLTVSRFDFGKRPGAPAERQVAFTPVQAAEADVGQAAAPQTLEKSLGLLLAESRQIKTDFVQPYSPRATHEQHENGVRVMLHASRVAVQIPTQAHDASQEVKRSAGCVFFKRDLLAS